jgi:hypothetical protein
MARIKMDRNMRATRTGLPEWSAVKQPAQPSVDRMKPDSSRIDYRLTWTPC